MHVAMVWLTLVFYTSYISAPALGSVFSSALNGYLCSTLGWQWAFYVPGILGGSWCILYFLVMPRDIDHHPRMSQVSF